MKYVFYISKSMPHKWTTYRRDTEKRNGDSWHLPKGEETVAEPFDVHRIMAKLKGDSGLKEKSEGCCQFRQVRIEDKAIASICVMTDYPHARAVASALGSLLYDEPDVSLYDAERDMTEISGRSDVPAESFILARQTYMHYRAAIINKFLPQRPFAAKWGFYKLGEAHCGCIPSIDAVVTAASGDFRECFRRFDRILKEIAAERDEEVLCRYDHFTVHSNGGFNLNFYLEGIGKCPQYAGWMCDGRPTVRMLHRSGIWRTLRAIDKMPRGELEHIRSRLYYGENLVGDSGERNLADRFVDSYKLSKLIKKHNLDVIYGERPYDNHSYVSFWTNDEDYGWDTDKVSSIIHFCDEDQAYAILAAIAEIIPSYWDYYYEKFYVRPEETLLILSKMKQIRDIVSKNPSSDELGEFKQVFLRTTFACDRDVISSADDYDKGRVQSLFKHRHDIVALYDIFMRWMDHVKRDGFYVEGP